MTLATDRFVTVPGLVTVVVTVMAAVPGTPSLVAVIVTEPALRPLTRPVEETVATAALEPAQVTTLRVSVLSVAALVVALCCTVCPATRLAVVGVTLTDVAAGGGGGGAAVTVMAAVPGTPSLIAVIVTEPALR